MSVEKQKQQSLRWWETARQDFDDGVLLMNNKRYAAACFHFQQAGEKALKAAMFSSGCDPWGHSLVKLLSELLDKMPDIANTSLMRDAKVLDKLYIPTRYPDGLPDITPAQAFDTEDAKAGMNSATNLLKFAKGILGNQPPTPKLTTNY